MANGERCKHCGENETEHMFGAVKEDGELCEEFVSEVKHRKSCPVLGCDGDCAAFARAQKKEKKKEQKRWKGVWDG